MPEIDISKNTIIVNDVVYDIKREPDRGHPEETLQVTEFNVVSDEWEYPFPGLEATLGYDDDTEHADPREWSNVGTISVSYRGYNLGDEDISEIDFEVECPRCKDDITGEDPNGNWVVGIVFPTERLAIGTQEECQAFLDKLPDVETGRYYIEPFSCPKCEGECVVSINPVDYFKKERGARVVLPLIVYDHSGITMRVGHVGDIMGDSAGWDTSFVGFTFDTPEKVKECMGDNATDKEIEAALRQEIETYASYLEGDVTYYVVQDEETDYFDSCGGYVGDHEQCEKECFESLANAIVKRLAEQDERDHWNSRDVPTL